MRTSVLLLKIVSHEFLRKTKQSTRRMSDGLYPASSPLVSKQLAHGMNSWASGSAGAEHEGLQLARMGSFDDCALLVRDCALPS